MYNKCSECGGWTGGAGFCALHPTAEVVSALADIPTVTTKAGASLLDLAAHQHANAIGVFVKLSTQEHARQLMESRMKLVSAALAYVLAVANG